MKIKYEYKEEGNEYLTPCPFGKDCTVGSWVCNECKHHMHENQVKRIVQCTHPEAAMSKTDRAKKARRKWRQKYLGDIRTAIREAMTAAGYSETEIKSALHHAHKTAEKAFNAGMRCADIIPILADGPDAMEDYTKGWLFRGVLQRPNIKLDEKELNEMLKPIQTVTGFRGLREYIEQEALKRYFVEDAYSDLKRKATEQLAP